MARDQDDAPDPILTDIYRNSYETEVPGSPGRWPRTKGRGFSRRELFKRAGMAGAAAAIPAGVAAQPPAQASAPAAAAAVAATPVAFETLTASAFDTLEAIVARLIPADEHGPGAKEAGAAHFIDRALGGPLVGLRDAYYTGLAGIDAHAESSRGAPFVKLAPKDQDAVLSDVEKNLATGFGGRSSVFFALLRTHTIQGMFCDPYHGGNADFVGWDLIGYPGVRLSAGPDDQRIDKPSGPTHRSAYDYPMFVKQSTRSQNHDH